MFVVIGECDKGGMRMLHRLQKHPPDPEARAIDPAVRTLSAAELSILFAIRFTA